MTLKEIDTALDDGIDVDAATFQVLDVYGVTRIPTMEETEKLNCIIGTRSKSE